ncbi:SDR family oxidoreductase [Neobacillus mesonae]|uniref:SDR family oxidoreductase n=1 Tax=Neobacillus mesonae TaxID=1193713 RepID=UPI00203A62F0|nr:SDR family oxidoreductase [Neobacillus mesonae]MCM3567514.1 SDR family oxidoreductase [Neobacillus mesonae]
MFGLEGKKAIVTGGRRGLGRGMAYGLHKAGAEVVLIDISNEVEKTKQEFTASQAKVHALTGDLSNREDRHRLFQDAVKLLGGELDILVNAAGINDKGPSVEYPIESWNRTFEINVTAVFEFCKFAGGMMAKQGSGKIINICSLTSFIGHINGTAYSASKGAVAQMTKSLSNEWARYGVQVNAIAPGCMETEMTKSLSNEKERFSELTSRIPAGRWGTPEDLEGIVVFLSSQASNYITGTIIPVDGGYLAR